MKTFDYIVIGAGIIGLTIAREIRLRFPNASLLIIEKEKTLGVHASGRNSGVLHSGLYYPTGSQKAKHCAKGNLLLREYTKQKGLKLLECGKIICSKSSKEDSEIERLHEQAKLNSVETRIVEASELKKIEPFAKTNRLALFSPNTAIFDPLEILGALRGDLTEGGTQFQFQSKAIEIRSGDSSIKTDREIINFGHIVNASGTDALKIWESEFPEKRGEFSLIPFRGTYLEILNPPNPFAKMPIYPVPDKNLPFLGVHLTNTLDGKFKLGPNAVPALGPENYAGLNGASIDWALKNSIDATRMILNQENNLISHLGSEIIRNLSFYIKSEASKIIQGIEKAKLSKYPKTGIRPQLIDKSGRLMMDLTIKNGTNSTHILNSISPAFTCSFSMAREVAEGIKV